MDGPISTLNNKPPTPTKRKSGVGRGRESQNVRKKHLEQKFLLCGFAVHAFLAAPVYLYGILYDSTYQRLIRIWPSILYQAVQQFCLSFLQPFVDQPQNGVNVFNPVRNRNIIVFASIITCLAITICGYLLSTSWIGSKTAELSAVIVYGVFGGLGSSLILAQVHHIIEIVRPKEDKYVRKTITLCGEAFCQLFLSFVVTSLETLYGTADALFLMGSLILNIIPLSLLLSKYRIKKQQPLLVQPTTTPPHPRTGEYRFSTLPGVTKISSPSANQLDGIEMQQKSWKNPNETHYNFVTPADEAYVTFVTPNGVEIMEIIPEEDEISVEIRANSIVGDTNSMSSTEFRFSVTCKKPGEINPETDGEDEDDSTAERAHRIFRSFVHNVADKMTGVWKPMCAAIVIPTLYPATLLQSLDTFSCVLCLTILPDLAINLRLKVAEIPFVFSLLAFPWMCFALMTPRFGQTLVKSKIKWHIFGACSKALGLLLISLSSSKLLLSMGTVFLGFGQAVTIFLQDLVIKGGFSPSKWNAVKYPMHATNSLLIVGFGLLSHMIISKYGFEEAIGLMAILYFSSVILWYLIMIITFIFKL